jgi:hypothetical protein
VSGLEQPQGDDPRGGVVGSDERRDARRLCLVCDEWRPCREDHYEDDYCREDWAEQYPGVPWGEDPRPETDEPAPDYSEEETVVGVVAAACARAARLDREAKDRADYFEDRERDDAGLPRE